MENKRKSLKISNSKFSCDLCNKEFSRNYFLQFHKLSHLNSKPFQCKECGKVFQQSFPYKKHLHIHNPLQKKVGRPNHQKVFHCLTCNRSFLNRSTLVKHQKAFHGQGFLCEVCGTQFLYQGSLDRHRFAHSAQQGSTWDVQRRERPTSLNLPLNIYTGKVFRCKQCSKLYATCSALEKHVLITHRLRTKPFLCKNCGKHFSCHSSLKVHLRIHSRFKPYICKCGCAFARKDLLVTHLQNDHKKFPVE